jgi:precorrin-3B synthase
VKRGWCPTVHEPMPTGDGLLVRVKPEFCRLTAGQARLLAHRADMCGNGIIELTGRGNLQIRGLTAASAKVFADAMVAACLASADAAIERRRNVTVSPLADADPAVAEDTLALAAAIEAMLRKDSALDALPAKFAFAIDGGGALPLSVGADIVLRADGSRHWVNGAQIEGGLQAVMARVRNCPPTAGDRRAASGAMAGYVGYPGLPLGAFALGLPFGQTDSAQLKSLADLAAAFSDGVLRLSPWRALLLGVVRAADQAALSDAAAGLGVITQPTDRRLSMVACIGADGCASGTVRTRSDAASLAQAGWSAEGGAVLHVSGCAKGCAHPGPASATLVGEAGSYNLVRGGSAGDRPHLTGLTLAQAAAAV